MCIRPKRWVPATAVLATIIAVVAFVVLLSPEPASPLNLTPQDRALIQRHNAFGFNLSHRLCQDGGNVFISPPSIALALSMTYNGARGETKLAMARALGIEDMPLHEVNLASKTALSLLQDPDPRAQLDIANSIWANEEVEFKEKFLSDNEEFFDAHVEVLEFDDEALKAINNWVSKNTGDKIPKILEAIEPDQIMFLINAIYFEGEWSEPFNPKLTEEREFILRNGSKKMHPMMAMDGERTFDYLETKEFQAVRLPYGETGRLGMYIFLPQDLDGFIQELTPDNWNRWRSEFKERELKVAMPKLRLEYSKRLNDVLSSLGMGVAFTPAADFGALTDETAWIDFVDHKTFLEVDEKGTKAAAVTVVAVERSSGGLRMVVDRPFFLAIEDSHSDGILFMGLIEDPTAG